MTQVANRSSKSLQVPNTNLPAKSLPARSLPAKSLLANSLLANSLPTKSLLAAALLLPLAAWAASDAAAEPETEAATDMAEAGTLFESNCTNCHGSEVYTRDDRRVASLSGLEAQVRRCETSLELQWFDEQVMAVTDLLNTRYYHFKP
ncbi:Green heme protein [Thiorhodovibrio winogradskyi]|uniref:Green heme protein n=1 Tax=Thiorhodovibrio winogradskyi TaxID=77007 RepID=A0ABZ0S7I2_9GAMM|nr:hypothetical protein [Thiorhodovibrio winogradskyi]